MSSPRSLSVAAVAIFAFLLGALLAPFWLAAGPAAAAPLEAPAEPLYFLQGRVYQGDSGTEPPTSTPLAGVTVTLYCANNPTIPTGSLLAQTTTDATGFYALATSAAACEWFNIVHTPLAGYEMAGATSVSGTVTADRRSLYQAPLNGQTLTGNKFWDI